MGGVSFNGGLPMCTSTRRCESRCPSADFVSISRCTGKGSQDNPGLEQGYIPLRRFESVPTWCPQIDLPAAQPDRVKEQMHSIFGIDPAEVLHISAKRGEGINVVLRAIIERIPPPSGEVKKSLKAILFDSS